MNRDIIYNLLNSQIAKEQYAAQLYLSMSAWFYERDLDGIANYFRIQSKEELMHAEKFFDFLNDLGGKIVLQSVEQPPHDFTDAQSIFEKALEHEKLVTQSIFAIVKAANEIGDYSTASFLQWFVNEQVEEEATAQGIVDKIKKAGDTGIFFVDSQLGQR